MTHTVLRSFVCAAGLRLVRSTAPAAGPPTHLVRRIQDGRIPDRERRHEQVALLGSRCSRRCHCERYCAAAPRVPARCQGGAGETSCHLHGSFQRGDVARVRLRGEANWVRQHDRCSTLGCPQRQGNQQPQTCLDPPRIQGSGICHRSRSSRWSPSGAGRVSVSEGRGLLCRRRFILAYWGKAPNLCCPR